MLPGLAPKLLARRAALSAQPAARAQARGRRRGSPLVRRMFSVGAGRAEQLPASAAAPTAGRAGGEVRTGPSPLAQSGSAKFWCACPGSPGPIGALPSTRDSLSRRPEGRARADGPGQAVPSLPVAERPAALRCRSALRRTLFPLPGASPAVRKPEAVSPRSASPRRRQRPGKSQQQRQGQGCGRSLSRAAESRGRAGQSAPDRLRSGSQPGPAEIHYCGFFISQFFSPKLSTGARREREGIGLS